MLPRATPATQTAPQPPPTWQPTGRREKQIATGAWDATISETGKKSVIIRGFAFDPVPVRKSNIGKKKHSGFLSNQGWQKGGSQCDCGWRNLVPVGVRFPMFGLSHVCILHIELETNLGLYVESILSQGGTKLHKGNDLEHERTVEDISGTRFYLQALQKRKCLQLVTVKLRITFLL